MKSKSLLLKYSFYIRIEIPAMLSSAVGREARFAVSGITN